MCSFSISWSLSLLRFLNYRGLIEDDGLGPRKSDDFIAQLQFR